jgi:putative transposase
LMQLESLKARARRRRLPSDLGERQASAVAANVLNRTCAASALNHQMDCGVHTYSEEVGSTWPRY